MAYRVLLVDDEPWALKDMEMSFPWEKYGFEVAGSCTKSEEACRMMFNLCPDVVVTDIRMPGMSGVELLRRAREEGLDSIFVLVSGVSDFEAARLGMRYGAVEYCMKPLDDECCEEVVQRIAGMLGEKPEEHISASMQSIRSYIDAGLHKKLSMNDVARKFHISANTLGRLFRSELHTTFGQYVQNRRLEIARTLLSNRDLSVREISDRLGYSDPNYFCVCFKRQFDMTPMQYRNQEGGEAE